MSKNDTIDRTINSENRIALLTSLMMTLITLGIIMSVMYLITSSIQRTGASKRYKSALAASYGGTELFTKDLLPVMLQNLNATSISSTTQSSYQNLNLSVTATDSCLLAKLTSPTSKWPISCDKSINPKTQPDFSLTLQSTDNVPFTVYSKIVDTVFGNTDMGGLQLGGAGVAEGQTTLSPQHFPYVFRLEVEAEKAANATEKSNVSVIYAY